MENIPGARVINGEHEARTRELRQDFGEPSAVRRTSDNRCRVLTFRMHLLFVLRLSIFVYVNKRLRARNASRAAHGHRGHQAHRCTRRVRNSTGEKKGMRNGRVAPPGMPGVGHEERAGGMRSGTCAQYDRRFQAISCTGPMQRAYVRTGVQNVHMTHSRRLPLSAVF